MDASRSPDNKIDPFYDDRLWPNEPHGLNKQIRHKARELAELIGELAPSSVSRMRALANAKLAAIWAVDAIGQDEGPLLPGDYSCRFTIDSADREPLFRSIGSVNKTRFRNASARRLVITGMTITPTVYREACITRWRADVVLSLRCAAEPFEKHLACFDFGPYVEIDFNELGIGDAPLVRDRVEKSFAPWTYS